MTVIVGVLVGFLTGRLLWMGMRRSWDREPFLRQNFNGRTLPTAAGIAIVMTILVVEAGRAIAGAAGIGIDPGLTEIRAAVVALVLGFGLLGLLDDLAGTSKSRGFAGHLKALARGEMTSGAVKMFRGAAVAITCAAMLPDDGLARLLINAAVIALAANLANLFDLRPGRTIKFSLVVFVALALLTVFDDGLVPVAVIIGAAIALLGEDLRERLMISDTGANILGAGLGLGVVSQVGLTGAVISLVVLLALNLASEVISFTKLIERVGPLRAFDMLGRHKTTALVDVRNQTAAPQEQAAEENADYQQEYEQSRPESARQEAPRPALSGPERRHPFISDDEV